MQKIVILMVVAVIAFLLLSGTDVYAKGKRSASEYKSYNGAKAIELIRTSFSLGAVY